MVTGGAGYIGSVLVEELINAGHEVVVLDDLSKRHETMVHPEARFVEGNVRDTTLVEQTLKQNGVEAVVHMAASSLVGESVREPEKYFDNNVTAGIAMLDAMSNADVKKLVFSSTAAVYGEPLRQPIVESDQLQPTNPYGASKLEFEHELGRRNQNDGLAFTSLRYFNAAGASRRCGEMHDPETHLIPNVLQVAIGRLPHVDVFGNDYPTPDGTCVRDYIHVIDLARAHILALDNLEKGEAKVYNLGCGGSGYSVRQVIDIAREVTQKEIPGLRPQGQS